MFLALSRTSRLTPASPKPNSLFLRKFNLHKNRDKPSPFPTSRSFGPWRTQKRWYAETVEKYTVIDPLQDEETSQLNEKMRSFEEHAQAFSDFESKILRVTAISTASKYNLVTLRLRLVQLSPTLRVDAVKRKRKDTEYLHISVTEHSNVPKDSPIGFAYLNWMGQDRDYIIFEDGVFVGWGMSEADQQSLEKMLLVYSTNVYPQNLREDMIFFYGEKNDIDTDHDKLVLSKDSESGWIAKLTFSYALARSVKLDGIELDVESALNKAKQLKFDSSASKLEAFAALDRPRTELANLHRINNDIEVKARVMEPPIVLWDHPSSYTDLYFKAAEYFSFETRQEVINKKLELPMNYWTLENEQATSIMGWRLEKMIILLIIIEIVFHTLEKSEWWEEQTWEKWLRKFLGLKTNDKTEKNEDYEIVEEIYEIVEQKPKS